MVGQGKFSMDAKMKGKYERETRFLATILAVIINVRCCSYVSTIFAWHFFQLDVNYFFFLQIIKYLEKKWILEYAELLELKLFVATQMKKKKKNSWAIETCHQWNEFFVISFLFKRNWFAQFFEWVNNKKFK